MQNYTLVTYGDDKGGIWLNTMRGVFYRPSLHQPAIPIIAPPLNYNRWHGIANFHFNSKDSRLWFGNARHGVFYYNLNTNKTYGIPSFNKKVQTPRSPSFPQRYHHLVPHKTHGSLQGRLYKGCS